MRGTHRTWRDKAEPEIFGGGTEPKLVSSRGLERLNFRDVYSKQTLYCYVTKRIITIFDYICDHFSKKKEEEVVLKLCFCPDPVQIPTGSHLIMRLIMNLARSKNKLNCGFSNFLTRN